ncbi:MAG: DUF1738 domain-containing protein [Planctomycetes bacterium]|nr:DUF1738 domain-containing protein [Planctomycetota bacterium]
MNTEQARKTIDEALSRLSDALAQGKSESLTMYLAAIARFHRYSLGNLLLILSQRPDATRVAGFQTWKQLGRFVKKGERGLFIIAPMRCCKKVDDASDVNIESSDDDESFIRFRAVHVFDISQTDGEPLPEPVRASGDPAGYTERLKAFVADKAIALEYSSTLGSAYGRSSGGKITLREGMPPAEEFSVLVHELAHELLHPKGSRGELSKLVKETEAEAVAFVVSHAIGLDAAKAAADYIQVYRGDKDTLAESLQRIQATAGEILEAITPSE